MARFMEVTGLRVVADAGDQAQVQYTVVNHSTFDLSDIALRVSVRSTAGEKAPPLFTVTARVSRLGPHESKEIRTGLDSQLKPSQIPGWEHLRTEVKILPAQ